MRAPQNPYEPPLETDGRSLPYATVPVSIKFYGLLLVCLASGALFFAIVFRELFDGSWPSVVLFAAVLILLGFSLWHTSCYLIAKDRYSLTIDELGVFERGPIYSQRFYWHNVESVTLKTIDSSKRYVTYRLREPTITRYLTCGAFDAMHYNQYAISQEALFEIITKYRSQHLSSDHGEPCDQPESRSPIS